MHIHHLTLLVIFLPHSWYGKDRTIPTTGHPYRRPKSICSSAYFNIFLNTKKNKKWLTLSIDNQWTVEWHTLLPYKINQFHVQHEFLFSSKRPVLLRSWPKTFFLLRSQILVIVKVLPQKNSLINIKRNKCTPKSVLRWGFASVYIDERFELNVTYR